MTTAMLIANPAAGRRRVERQLPEIRQALKSLNVETDLVRTRAPGHGSELAARAEQAGYELVIAVGGDGTVHEVVGGLVAAAGDGTAGTLGIIPLGTGNDFIKVLDVPKDWRAACAKIAEGKTRRIDVGRVNDSIFNNNVGIGFDAQVGIEAQKIKRLRGTAVYMAALARTMLLSYSTPSVTIQLDGETIEQRITLLTIGNGRCSGGAFWLTPDALLDDGVFDVCIARGLSKPQILALVPFVMKGTHTKKSSVRMARAARISVHSDAPLPVHADGEILYTAAHQLDIELLPHKLDVIG